MPKKEDMITERHAQIVARDYGLAPYEPLKCERTVPEGTARTLFFANTSNVVKVLIKYDRDAPAVSGILKPNATGVFLWTGHHNGENYFRRTDEAWFLWWDGVDTWNLSAILDVQGDSFWTRTNPAIEGEYVPQGTAVGTPTVEPPNF